MSFEPCYHPAYIQRPGFTCLTALPGVTRIAGAQPGPISGLCGIGGLGGMDGLNRLRRQNEPPVHSNPEPVHSFNDPSQQRYLLSGISDERYRPASLPANSSTGRGMIAAGSDISFYSELSASFYTANMPHIATASEGFDGYNTAAREMYHVGQLSTPSTVYDLQNFSSRQSPVMQKMPPEVASSYFGSETGTSVDPSLRQSARGPNGPASIHQQSNAISYASNSIQRMSTLPQTENVADVSMTDDHNYAEGTLEEKWDRYQRQLGSIFQDIVNGSLESASETLLDVTSWLLSQVADLGLNLDDTNLHADRLGQRQIDLMNSSQQPLRSQSIISKVMIKKMGNELVRLCDGIERHGLVDYQYGVWEDQITAVLEGCLDLYDDSEEKQG
ncbi:hypothetical protein IWW34DRAFT_902305 [Fusarium oxysporum f. sp. albedinis]|nr:hypothetical protein IWW34DRAFT_902305 [Fusarium oxysporum f. sp. albedinis]